MQAQGQQPAEGPLALRAAVAVDDPATLLLAGPGSVADALAAGAISSVIAVGAISSVCTAPAAPLGRQSAAAGPISLLPRPSRAPTSGGRLSLSRPSLAPASGIKLCMRRS